MSSGERDIGAPLRGDLAALGGFDGAHEFRKCFEDADVAAPGVTLHNPPRLGIAYSALGDLIAVDLIETPATTRPNVIGIEVLNVIATLHVLISQIVEAA